MRRIKDQRKVGNYCQRQRGGKEGERKKGKRTESDGKSNIGMEDIRGNGRYQGEWKISGRKAMNRRRVKGEEEERKKRGRVRKANNETEEVGKSKQGIN